MKIGHNELERLNIIAELKGQIIDIFEDFLTEKGIEIPNPEKEEDENLEPDEAAIIYGSDYDWLGDKIEQIIAGWDIMKLSQDYAQVSIDTPAGELVSYVGDNGECTFAGVMLKPKCRLDKGEDTEIDVAYVETQGEDLRAGTDVQADDVVVYTYLNPSEEDYTNRNVITGESVRQAMEE